MGKLETLEMMKVGPPPDGESWGTRPLIICKRFNTASLFQTYGPQILIEIF